MKLENIRMNNIKLSSQAKSLHYNTLFIDASQAAPMTQDHFNRLHMGGVKAVNYTCAKITDNFCAASLNIQQLLRTINHHHDQVMLIRGLDDIKTLQKEDKVGIIAGLQSSTPVQDNLNFIELLYLLGIRVIQLTYNERNLIGDGCVEITNAGLSRFGKDVIKEMNRIGILIDLSHCGEHTTLEAIKTSEKPVWITHANAKSLCPSQRNKSNEVLKALKDNGGVICAAFWAPITYSDPHHRPCLEDVLRQIDYLVEHAGIDHVGIGSDMGEGESRENYETMFIRGGGIYPEITRDLGDWYTFDTRMVKGLESVVNFPIITEGLLRHGYSDSEIQKILGENIYRVLSQSLK